VVVGLSWRVEISVHGDGDDEVSFKLKPPTVEDVSWGQAKQHKTDRAKEKTKHKKEKGQKRKGAKREW